MHEEWQDNRADPAFGSTTSWSTRRLLAVAGLVAAAALVIGVGVAHLFTRSSVAAGPDIATRVAGDVETAPETEILDAEAVVRGGDGGGDSGINGGNTLDPAPTADLTVVQVSVSACDARSIGSGFLVADGLILTAAHVVGDAALVRIDHEGVTVTGEVLGVFADGRDAALIALDAPLAVPLTGAPVPTDVVTLVGHPDGGPRTALVGPVVEVAPIVASLAGGGDIVGVDVTISEGISGGPAVDAAGRVVGLVVAKEAETDTALVLALGDLAEVGATPLASGECPGTA